MLEVGLLDCWKLECWKLEAGCWKSEKGGKLELNMMGSALLFGRIAYGMPRAEVLLMALPIFMQALVIQIQVRPHLLHGARMLDPAHDM